MNAYTVNRFYNDCGCWFHPTSLYSELATACTGKRWCFCRLSVVFLCLSERFIRFVYDNHMVICWESIGMLSDTDAILGIDISFPLGVLMSMVEIPLKSRHPFTHGNPAKSCVNVST